MSDRYIVVERPHAPGVFRVWRKMHEDDDDSAVPPLGDYTPYPTAAAAQAVCDQRNQRVADRVQFLNKVKVNQCLQVKDINGREKFFLILRKHKAKGDLFPRFYGWNDEEYRILDSIEMYTEMEIIEEANS